MALLQSFLAGRWQAGDGQRQDLVNPATEETLAEASSAGLDLGAALKHARDVGGPALRRWTFAERSAALKELSAALHAHREELISLGIANAGNTRSDAKFDIDGATGTLAAYAALGSDLPGGAFLSDGPGMQLGRSPRFHGQHIRVPRLGVAVHINAFNFPAWGMLEKTACALLAGMPVLEKPGTATAMMAERIARIVIESEILPEGAFSFLAGPAGDLLDHVGAQDCVAFTGSGATARQLRAHAAFVDRGARLNVEADSLNAAILGPDADDDDELLDLFVNDAVREMTQKAGQKCTATRRLLVPAARVDATVEALTASLKGIEVGDPARREVRMGPLASDRQLADVQTGIGRLAQAARTVTGGPNRFREPGYFVAPTLLRADDAEAAVLHADEVFGPVATVLPCSGGVEEIARLVRLGGGSLVTSVYSDDRRLPATLALELAPWSGRVYLTGSRLAGQGTGPGVVLPALVHGGPGRAGGGEELGGLRGLHFYMQRTALQGAQAVIAPVFGPS